MAHLMDRPYNQGLAAQTLGLRVHTWTKALWIIEPSLPHREVTR